MHRNDGLNFDPDIGDGGRGFIDQNLPSVPGSVMASPFGNAIQQELVHLIEDVGITLEPSGAADKAAGWVQLLQAIRLHTRKTGVWVDATQYGLNGGSPVQDENIDALNAAFAASNKVYIPPGYYTFASSPGKRVVIPAGGELRGAGWDTILQPMTPSDGFIVCSDTTTVIRDLKIFALSVTGTVIETNFSFGFQSLTMERVGFENQGLIATDNVAINIDADTTQDGRIILRNCTFAHPASGYPGGITLQSLTDLQSTLYVENCIFDHIRIELFGDNGFSPHKFVGCQFIGGGFYTFAKCEETQMINCTLSIDQIFFRGTWGMKWINTYDPKVYGNTVFNDYDGLTSKVFFINTSSGSPVQWLPDENYNGVRTFSDQNADKGYPPGLSTVAWDNPTVDMAYVGTYTGESIAAADGFSTSSSCNGKVKVNLNIVVDGDHMSDVDMYLEIAGVTRVFLQKSLHANGTETVYSLRGHVHSDTVSLMEVKVRNYNAANITVLKNAVAPFTELKTEWEMEGL